jgi:hypothetical protein
MLKSVVIGIFVLVLSSCGGSTSTPTDPNQSFSLSRLQSTTLGTVYSSQLTGSDSNGVHYTGSVSMANRAQTMLKGVLVTQRDFIISISGGGTSMTFTATSNVDTSGNLISVVIQTTGLTCSPESPDAMPTTVKIGDFGILPAMTCSDNTTTERNWRVEDAGNGNINVISNATVKDQSNTMVSAGDATITINGSGNIVAFKIVFTQLASKYTLTLKVHKSHNNGLHTESLRSAIRPIG